MQERQSIYGRNEVVHEQKKNPFILFIKTFINPFIGVLTGLAIISLFLDVLMADPGEQEWTGVIIISSMVLFSAILRFWQEWRASEATDSLMKMVKNTCLAKRAGEDVYKRQGHTYTISGSNILVFSAIKQFKQVFFIRIRHTYTVIRQTNDCPLLPIGDQD